MLNVPRPCAKKEEQERAGRPSRCGSIPPPADLSEAGRVDMGDACAEFLARVAATHQTPFGDAHAPTLLCVANLIAGL